MKKENNVEANVIIHEKAYSKKMRYKLMMRQTKNGISPWQKIENKKNGIHSLQERNKSTPTLIDPETSKPLPVSTEEDIIEDFNIELTQFNDLVIRCNPTICSEYMPYYRTDTNLVESPSCINSEVNQDIPEGEDRVQSNCCVFKLKYKEESTNERDLDSEYFPYYRTYEEHLKSSNSSEEIKSREQNEEVNANGDEKMSEAVSSAETEYANTDFQESSITNEDTGQCLENFDFTETLLSTKSTIDSSDSENFLLEEILSRNQLPSSSNGYFPYYRTYDKLIVTPKYSVNFSPIGNSLG